MLDAVSVVEKPCGYPASASSARAFDAERVKGLTDGSKPKAPRGIIAGTSRALPPSTALISRGTSIAWLSACRTRWSPSGPPSRVFSERYEVRMPG